MTGVPLNASQVFTLQMREIVRTYVRELAGWAKEDAQREFMESLKLIERAKAGSDLAARLLAAEPKDLNDLITGSLLDLDEDRQVNR
jgi:hypothetical protein